MACSPAAVASSPSPFAFAALKYMICGVVAPPLSSHFSVRPWPHPETHTPNSTRSGLTFSIFLNLFDRSSAPRGPARGRTGGRRRPSPTPPHLRATGTTRARRSPNAAAAKDAPRPPASTGGSSYGSSNSRSTATSTRWSGGTRRSTPSPPVGSRASNESRRGGRSSPRTVTSSARETSSCWTAGSVGGRPSTPRP